MKNDERTMFEIVGGREAIDRVMKTFYDKIYAHPWIGKYFQEIDQKIIESQQGDFIQRSFGGGPVYSGKLPIPAHKNMFITEELYELRHQLLIESIKAEGIPQEVADRWIVIDDAFRKGLIKKNISDCEKRFFTDPIIAYDKDGKKIA